MCILSSARYGNTVPQSQNLLHLENILLQFKVEFNQLNQTHHKRSRGDSSTKKWSVSCYQHPFCALFELINSPSCAICSMIITCLQIFLFGLLNENLLNENMYVIKPENGNLHRNLCFIVGFIPNADKEKTCAYFKIVFFKYIKWNIFGFGLFQAILIALKVVRGSELV